MKKLPTTLFLCAMVHLSIGQITPSHLSDGSIYKIAVESAGLYKLSYSFLKDDLGISNIDNINPNEIKILGNTGGPLPESIAAIKSESLSEIAVLIDGADDNSFDANDYILFYAEGPDRWEFDSGAGIFNMKKNIYASKNHYFIKVSSGNGKRINSRNSDTGSDYTSTSFLDFQRLENDKVNLLHDWAKAQGSGQKWYGDHFKNARSFTYNDVFKFPKSR